jgi:hypothetical protein
LDDGIFGGKLATLHAEEQEYPLDPLASQLADLMGMLRVLR